MTIKPNKVVGRKEEQLILSKVLWNQEAQLVAVYGRRRIGKTFLIKSFFADKIKSINLIGSKRLKNKDLLSHFRDSIVTAGLVNTELPTPNNWNDAFKLLRLVLETNSDQILIFIDEVPWFERPKSNFIGEFEHFWNSYATNRENLKIILCGSATSWMLKKLIYNKEGLHNRFTARINLKPFSIQEANEFLLSKSIKLTSKNLLELYLSIGGIAEYLKWIDKANSSAVIINDLCFKTSGNLFEEYESLVPALFSDPEKYNRLILALTKKTQGSTFKELEQLSGVAKGTTLARMLTELELNSFVTAYTPYSWGNVKLYRLTDPYLIFYHKWIQSIKKQGVPVPENYWMQTFNSQSFRIWTGYSYETFCFTHISDILKQIGISGMRVKPSIWRSKLSKQGAQIDLVLERADHIINLCEIKFHTQPIVLDDKLENELMRKVSIFQEETKSKTEIVPLLISASEVINKGSSIMFIDKFGYV